jgi:NAD(P)-dependent dehydrogenase (short-subunit alcohol dehydrogenase family)
VKRGGGRIIVLASMQGKHGSKNMASYSASKWGTIGLMKSAALELGKHHITVNALIPGLVDTPLTCNRARMRALVSEVKGIENPPDDPSPEKLPRHGLLTFRSGLPGSSRKISDRPRYSWHLIWRTWLPEPVMT